MMYHWLSLLVHCNSYKSVVIFRCSWQVRANRLAERDISKYNETDGHGLIGKFSMDGMDEARNNLHLMDCCCCHFVTAASLLAHAV